MKKFCLMFVALFIFICIPVFAEDVTFEQVIEALGGQKEYDNLPEYKLNGNFTDFSRLVSLEQGVREITSPIMKSKSQEKTLLIFKLQDVETGKKHLEVLYSDGQKTSLVYWIDSKYDFNKVTLNSVINDRKSINCCQAVSDTCTNIGLLIKGQSIKAYHFSTDPKSPHGDYIADFKLANTTSSSNN